MENKLSVFIWWGKMNNATLQKKTFKSEISAIKWCMRNYKNIVRIGEFWTCGQRLARFEVIDAIRGEY